MLLWITQKHALNVSDAIFENLSPLRGAIISFDPTSSPFCHIGITSVNIPKGLEYHDAHNSL